MTLFPSYKDYKRSGTSKIYSPHTKKKSNEITPQEIFKESEQTILLNISIDTSLKFEKVDTKR